MTTMQVLEASKLFENRSDIHKNIKNKSIKINNVQVEDVNETIEVGDFLNFVWFHGAVELMRNHGNTFLVVAKGKKQRSLIRVVGGTIQNLTDEHFEFLTQILNQEENMK